MPEENPGNSQLPADHPQADNGRPATCALCYHTLTTADAYANRDVHDHWFKSFQQYEAQAYLEHEARSHMEAEARAAMRQDAFGLQP